MSIPDTLKEWRKNLARLHPDQSGEREVLCRQDCAVEFTKVIVY